MKESSTSLNHRIKPVDLSCFLEALKKKTFLNFWKSCLFKSRREAHKNNSRLVPNGIKNTNIFKGNHTKCSNNLFQHEESKEETKSVISLLNNRNKLNFMCTKIIDVRGSIIRCDSINFVPAISKNNGNWISFSKSSSHGTEINHKTNYSDKFVSSFGHRDVGIQTKIPTYYKIYTFHKHISSSGRRKKKKGKSKQKLFQACTTKYKHNISKVMLNFFNHSFINFIDHTTTGDSDSNGFQNANYFCNGQNDHFCFKGYRKSGDNANKKSTQRTNNVITDVGSEDKKVLKMTETQSNSDNVSKGSLHSLVSNMSVISKNMTCQKEVNQLPKIKKNESKNTYSFLNNKNDSLPSLRLFENDREKKSVMKFRSTPEINKDRRNVKVVNKKESNKRTIIKKYNEADKIFFKQINKNLEPKKYKLKKPLFKKRKLKKKFSFPLNKKKYTKHINKRCEETDKITSSSEYDTRKLFLKKQFSLNTKINISNETAFTNVVKENRYSTIYKHEKIKKSELNNNDEGESSNKNINNKQMKENNKDINKVYVTFATVLNRKPILTYPLQFFNDEMKSEKEFIYKSTQEPNVINQAGQLYSDVFKPKNNKRDYQQNNNKKYHVITNSSKLDEEVTISSGSNDNLLSPGQKTDTQKYLTFNKDKYMVLQVIDDIPFNLNNSIFSKRFNSNKFSKLKTRYKFYRREPHKKCNFTPFSNILSDNDFTKVSNKSKKKVKNQASKNLGVSQNHLNKATFIHSGKDNLYFKNDFTPENTNHSNDKCQQVQTYHNDHDTTKGEENTRNIGVHGIFPGMLLSNRKTFAVKRIVMLK